MPDKITRLQARVKMLEDALRRLLTPFGDDACRVDHHGYCQEHFMEADCCVACARTALAASQPADSVINASCRQPVRVKHVKQGTSYRVLGVGKIQTETPLHDYDEVVIYQGEADGLMWVRSAAEFWDGRFESIEPTPVTPAEAAKLLLADKAALDTLVDVAEEEHDKGVSFGVVIGRALRAIGEGK